MQSSRTAIARPAHAWSLLLLLGFSAPLSAETPAPTFPDPPRLAVTRAELEQRKQQADFPAVKAAALQAADRWLASPPPLPNGPGSWTFYYACPDDGADLRMLSLEEHECPKCKQRYRDERTQAAYRCQLHYAAERAALNLGWAYAYSGDDRYAAEVRRILVHFADQYADYPVRVDRWGREGIFAPLGGRRYVQSLDEAYGVILLAKAYDLTRTSPAWSDAHRAHVEADFFRATAETLLAFNQDINNHQTWYNAGLMAIASVLADPKLVEKVLTMRGGYRDQLRRSFGADGIWYEGAMVYQNYALLAVIELVDAGRRLGLPLEQEPALKTLLLSPLKTTYPNGAYPTINDSDPTNYQIFKWSYEWAWRTYREPIFAQAAAADDAKKLTEMLGPEAQPASPLETRSLDFPDAGWAALREGEGADQACVFFDYGQHGGGHGHFDKLNLTLFANGREWLLDTGRIGYTHSVYKTWIKHTVAHNTIVIDHKNQRPTTGKLLYFQPDKTWTACAGECTTAYAGVTLRRYLLLTPKLLVDVYEVHADHDVQMDWLAHAATQPVAPVKPLESHPAELGEGPGYQHLSEVRQWSVKGASQWDFADDRQWLRVWCAGAKDENVFTAIGIGARVDQPAPTLIRRRNSARSARFVTLYDLSGQGDFLQGVVVGEGSLPDLQIKTIDGASRIRFGATSTRMD